MWIQAYKNMDTYSMCNQEELTSCSEWHEFFHQMQSLAVNVNLKATTSNNQNDKNHF